MLFAYSDASVKGNIGVATTFIVTEDTFITCFSKTYGNVSSSVEVELLGVVQTMEYIYEHCKHERMVVLLMDNKSIAVRYIKMLSNWRVPKVTDFRAHYENLLEMSKGFVINIQHIRGHQHTHNPNKICDVLSKVCLSYSKGGK